MNDMLEQVKGYLRIEGSEDDMNLTLLLDSAKEYFTNAGVSEKKDSALYRLSVIIYVSIQYDPDSYRKLERSLQSNILQMKYEGEAL
ncbi:head-tail connector protein [Bacillus cereus group sp. MYBK14-3]|uniref:head-tail connector protein n=1 Tax=unclassified Bacillus cereus group TaxID=2750818 RepID=UPI003F7A09DD